MSCGFPAVSVQPDSSLRAAGRSSLMNTLLAGTFGHLGEILIEITKQSLQRAETFQKGGYFKIISKDDVGLARKNGLWYRRQQENQELKVITGLCETLSRKSG